MSIKLSHSSLEKFKSCSEKWRLYYQKRLREDATHSPLFFGGALDAAISIFLLRKKKVRSPEEDIEAELDPYETFHKRMTWTTLNGKMIKIPTETRVHYNKADFDVRLLSDKDIEEIFEKFPEMFPEEHEGIEAFIEDYRSQKKHYYDQTECYNYINWVSLYNKGILMLQAYENEILPQIEEVFEIQKYVKLENEEKDSLIGYIDFIGQYKGEKYIFDNKTSSRDYAQDSVKKSQQLTIYGEHEGIFKAGFIVLLKDIKWGIEKTCINCAQFCEITTKKKCPECKDNLIETRHIPKVKTQIIVDDLHNDGQDKVFEEIQEIADNIKAGYFDKNWDSCFQFNRKCEFYSYCRSGSMEGLVQLEQTEDKDGRR